MDDEIDPLAEVGKTWSSVVSFIAPWAVEEQQQVRESPRGADVSDFSGPRDMKKPPPPQMNPMQNPPLQQHNNNGVGSERDRLAAEKRSLLQEAARATLALASTRSSNEKDGIYTVEGFSEGQIVHVHPSKTVVDVVIKYCAGSSSLVDVHIKGFCNSITLESCSNVRVACDGVIEGAKACRSHSLEIYLGGFAPPTVLEQCSSVGLHICTGTLIGLGIETKGCSDVLLYTSPTRNGVGITSREIMEMPPPKPAALPSSMVSTISARGSETKVLAPPVPTGSKIEYRPGGPVTSVWSPAVNVDGVPDDYLAPPDASELASGISAAVPDMGGAGRHAAPDSALSGVKGGIGGGGVAGGEGGAAGRGTAGGLSGAGGASISNSHHVAASHLAPPAPGGNPVGGAAHAVAPKYPYDVEAEHFYEAADDDELSFEEGDVLQVVGPAPDEGWVFATFKGRKGLAPVTHFSRPKAEAAAAAATTTTGSMPGIRATSVGGSASGGAAGVGTSNGIGASAGPDRSGLRESSALADQTLDEMTSVVDRMLQEAGHGGKFEAEDEALKKAEKSLAEQAVRPRPSPGGEAGFVFTKEQVAAFFPLDVPAAWEYEAMESDELSLRPGQVVRVTEPFEDEGWVVAEIGKARGIVPTPYLTRMEFPEIDAAKSSKPSRPDWLDDKPLPVKIVEQKQALSDIAPMEIPQPNPPLPDRAPVAAAAAPQSPVQDTVEGLVLDETNERMLPAKCTAAHDYVMQNDDELSFSASDVLIIMAKDEEGWLTASMGEGGPRGLVPCTHLENRLEPVQSQTRDVPTAVETVEAKPRAPMPSAAEAIADGPSAKLPPLQDPIPEGEGLELDSNLRKQLPLYCTAMFDFVAESEDELTVDLGTVVKVLSESAEDGWANCSAGGKTGIMPYSYLSKRVGRTPEELRGVPGGGGDAETERKREEQEAKARAEAESKAKDEEERRMQDERKKKAAAAEEEERKRKAAAAEEEERKKKAAAAEEEERKKKAAAASADSSKPSSTFSADKLPMDAIAEWDFDTTDPDELPMKKGEKLKILAMGDDEGWVVGMNQAGGKGLVPTTHLGKATSAAAAAPAPAPAPAPVPAAAAPAAPSSGGNPASTGGKFVVSKDVLPMDAVMEWDFDTTDPDELPMKKGEKLKILAMGDDEGWVVGMSQAGGKGLVPTTHLGKATSAAAPAAAPALPAAAAAAAAPAAPSSGGNPASTGGKFVVSKDVLPMDAVMEWDFDTTDPDELPMKKGEKLKILAMGDDEGWVVGMNQAGGKGLVPTTHLGKATSAAAAAPAPPAAAALPAAAAAAAAPAPPAAAALPAAAAAAAAPAAPSSGGNPASTGGKFVVSKDMLPMDAVMEWDFDTTDPDELPMKKGEKLKILAMGDDEGWVVGMNQAGGKGLVPTTHLGKATSAAAPAAAPGGGPQAATRTKVAIAEWNYEAQSVYELALKEGDELKVVGKSPDEGWVVAENATGGRGVVPETHIKYA